MNRVLSYAAQLKGFKSLISFVRQRPYVSIAGVIIIAILSIGAIILVARSQATADKAQLTSTQSASTQAAKAVDETKSAAPADTSITASDDNSGQKTEASKAAADARKSNGPKPTTIAPASKSKRLVISPSAITIQAGSAVPITVSTEDGTAVTMPMFQTQTPQLFTNFPAAPFKNSWSGSIMSARQSAPGTYALALSAQVNRNDIYTGNITVTVLPTPYITAAVTPEGYDAATDTLRYTARLIRHHGYDQPVTRWFGGYGSAPGPINMECAFAPVGTDTFAVECRHTYGPRPTSGQMSIRLFTTSIDSAGDLVPFTLPPR